MLTQLGGDTNKIQAPLSPFLQPVHQCISFINDQRCRPRLIGQQRIISQHVYCDHGVSCDHYVAFRFSLLVFVKCLMFTLSRQANLRGQQVAGESAKLILKF
ncbi:hypothetical protein D3C72_1680340 [compost metagenome]